MKLTEFQPEHLLEIEMVNTPDKVSEIRNQELIRHGVNRMGQNAFSAIHDGKIIGCGGVEILWQGVGEAWGVPSVYVNGHKKDIILICKEVLRIVWNQELELNRIQCSVIDGFQAGDKLAEILGFKCEGVMRKFGKNGEDYKLFALVR
jgi:hypothetical protein